MKVTISEIETVDQILVTTAGTRILVDQRDHHLAAGIREGTKGEVIRDLSGTRRDFLFVRNGNSVIRCGLGRSRR